MKSYLWTGQITCHDTEGREVPCSGSGQDAEFRRGIPWPEPRFKKEGDTVLDCLTGLVWTKNANIAEYPLMWQEALDYIADKNHAKLFGYRDWRLPNRRELRSLISFRTTKPALPEHHPFINVFPGWYWTSTTSAVNAAYAWYVHMEGARMFYGGKKQNYIVWPVRGEGCGILPATGQSGCFDAEGRVIPCNGTGQDGEFRHGQPFPEKRFAVHGKAVIDNLTGLCWVKKTSLAGRPVTWKDAVETVGSLNQKAWTTNPWRLPNINELESLVDARMHSPALPEGHPFEDVQEGYWSSTTSMFGPDWAWVLYMAKGAVGVGLKPGAHFHAWAVRDSGITGDFP